MHEEKREFSYVPGLFGDDVLEELRGHGKEYMRLMSYYASAMLEIETKFKVLSIEFNGKFDRNPIESIKTRLKAPKSIIEKMNRIGKPLTVESIEKELSDVAGVRVICSFVDDIYKLADMLALQDDIYVLRVKDYIKNPKESGYRSLHMIVEVPSVLSKEKRFMRGAAAHHRNGFLGQPGAQAALQEGYPRGSRAGDRPPASAVRVDRQSDGSADADDPQADRGGALRTIAHRKAARAQEAAAAFMRAAACRQGGHMI